MTVDVEPARPANLPEAVAVIHRAFATLADRIDPPSSAMTETVDTLAARVERGGRVFIARRQDGLILGAVCAAPKPDGSVYMDRLAVDPSACGQGIARALTDAVEDFARADGLGPITVGVRLRLPDNIALFRHLGYVETGRKAHPGFAEPTSMDLAKAIGRP